MIASIILIAILVIAVILIGFCFYTNRRKHGDVNLATVSVSKREREEGERAICVQTGRHMLSLLFVICRQHGLGRDVHQA